MLKAFARSLLKHTRHRDAHTGASNLSAGIEAGLRQLAHPLSARAGFRVLALVSDAYGSHGGIAKFNRDLLGSIAAIPTCAEVVCVPRVITQPLVGVPKRLRFLAEGARGAARFLTTVYRAMQQGPYDLVLIGHINLSPLGVWAARRLGCNSMLVVHGIDAWQKHKRRSVVRALPRVDEIVGVSQVTLDRLGAWAQLRHSRLHVLPNCVDLQRFTPGPKPPDLVISLGLEGKTVLMTFGRLASEDRCKGFDEIIELMPGLLTQRPDLVYLICGSGPDQARLQSKCEQLGVAQAVRFSGFVPEERKVDHYRLADAYVMPSRGEGFGIVFLEAMACGIPAMGSSMDGSAEALLGGELGELVNPSIPAEVQAGVLRTLARRKERPRRLDTFSFTAYSQRVAQLIDTVLTTPAASVRLPA